MDGKFLFGILTGMAVMFVGLSRLSSREKSNPSATEEIDLPLPGEVPLLTNQTQPLH